MTVPLKTRILLADDHEVVRDGLRMVLDSAPDLEVVAEASDGAEAVNLALSADVDLAVLDVTMPRMTGLQAALELSRRKPELRVLILSMHDNEQYFSAAYAPARLAPTMMWVWSLVMGCPRGQGQELLAGAGVIAHQAAQRPGDGLGAELLHAAQRHAQMLGLQDDANALGLELSLIHI